MSVRDSTHNGIGRGAELSKTATDVRDRGRSPTALLDTAAMSPLAATTRIAADEMMGEVVEEAVPAGVNPLESELDWVETSEGVARRDVTATDFLDSPLPHSSSIVPTSGVETGSAAVGGDFALDNDNVGLEIDAVAAEADVAGRDLAMHDDARSRSLPNSDVNERSADVDDGTSASAVPALQEGMQVRARSGWALAALSLRAVQQLIDKFKRGIYHYEDMEGAQGKGVDLYILANGVFANQDLRGTTGSRVTNVDEGSPENSAASPGDDWGTRVASCAAGKTVGVAPEADILSYYVGAGTTISSYDPVIRVLDGIRLRDQKRRQEDHDTYKGAVVLVAVTPDARPPERSLFARDDQGRDEQVYESVQKLIDNGVSIVTPAGDEDTPSVNNPLCKHPSVFCVGGINSKGLRSQSSNWVPGFFKLWWAPGWYVRAMGRDNKVSRRRRVGTHAQGARPCRL